MIINNEMQFLILMLTFKYVFICNFVLLLKFRASKFSWISNSNNLKW